MGASVEVQQNVAPKCMLHFLLPTAFCCCFFLFIWLSFLVVGASAKWRAFDYVTKLKNMHRLGMLLAPYLGRRVDVSIRKQPRVKSQGL